MLKRLNNSDTAVIVLHEIYGINEHIYSVCNELSSQGLDVFCPSLFDDTITFTYEQEDEAYDYFLNSVGFEKAFHKLKIELSELIKQYKRLIIIGYSIGATLAWLCSGESNLCDCVVGFYGSRIRHYSNVTPKCPVLLFFPEHEQSFDLGVLIATLTKKPKVKVLQLQGTHGFADPFSKKYVKESFEKAFSKIIKFIEVKY